MKSLKEKLEEIKLFLEDDAPKKKDTKKKKGKEGEDWNEEFIRLEKEGKGFTPPKEDKPF